MNSASKSRQIKSRSPRPGQGVVCSPDIEAIHGGVVIIRWPVNATIELSDALATISRIEELSVEEPRPLLIEMRGMRYASSAALNKFAESLPATRMALLGTSPVEQTIVRFFQTIHRPACPVSYFTQGAEALEWLAQVLPSTSPAIPFDVHRPPR